MSLPNVLPSDRNAVLATINPVSQGVGTAVSGWVSMQTLESILALIEVGVFGASATVDAKIQQAQDGSGTGAKDITGKAITQLVAASGNNRQALINVRAEELDLVNSFCFVQLSITVGTAATLISGNVIGMDARYQPVAQPTSVAQVVT